MDQGREKRVSSGEHFLGEGETQTVALVADRGSLAVDDRLSRPRVKMAAAEEALSSLKGVRPQPGRSYLLVVGLGSQNYWGDNNNGDSFPENALLGLPPEDVPMGFFDKFKARVKPGWGHKTFLDGHVFEEHRNSNPRLAVGGVDGSFWNTRMHRVENLIWFDRKKAPEWAQKYDEGRPIGTSMACRVPFDRCSVCGNLAPTKPFYCEHLRVGSPSCELRKIRHDGTSVSMINDFPHFFDESLVKTPAAPEAMMIAKAASLSGAAAVDEVKEAQVAEDREFWLSYHKEPKIPDYVLAKLAAYNLPEILTGADNLGVALKPSELFKVANLGPLGETLKSAADYLDSRVMERHPGTLPELGDLGSADLRKVAAVESLLAPYVGDRSYKEPYLTVRLMRTIKVASVAPVPVKPDAELDKFADLYHALYKKACGNVGYAPLLKLRELLSRNLSY